MGHFYFAKHQNYLKLECIIFGQPPSLSPVLLVNYCWRQNCRLSAICYLMFICLKVDLLIGPAFITFTSAFYWILLETNCVFSGALSDAHMLSLLPTHLASLLHMNRIRFFSLTLPKPVQNHAHGYLIFTKYCLI